MEERGKEDRVKLGERKFLVNFLLKGQEVVK
jgi:hypothetical protein